MNFKISNLDFLKISKHLALTFNLFFIFLIFISYLSFLPKSWNLSYFFIIVIMINVCFLVLKIKEIPEEKREKSLIVYYSSHFFLLTLIIIALNQFLKKDIITNNLFYISVLSIAFGVLTFYANRDRVEKEIEDEIDIEENNEKKRYKEFKEKFPKLAKFDFGYKISEAFRRGWENRKKSFFRMIGFWTIGCFRISISPFVFIARLPYSFIRWMYGEGWRYSVSLILIIIIALFLYSHGIGTSDFKEDEFLGVGAAASYYFEGSFYKWDWIKNKTGEFTECIESDEYCHYTRAWPHTLLISQSYKMFGISEWSSRIVSSIFGIFFIFLSYFFTKFFTNNKKVSILSSIVATFYFRYINIFRYTRMYALLIPLFLVSVYFGYKLLSKPNNINISNKFKKITNRIIPDFRIFYLVIFLLSLILNYFIHINSLIILPAISIFFIFLGIDKKDVRYMYLIILVLAMLPILIFLLINFGFFKILTELISPFRQRNFQYVGYLLKFPFGQNLGIIFLFISMIYSLHIKNKKIIYLNLIIASTLVFFIYIANRYASFTYTSHIVFLSMLIILNAYFYFGKLFKNKLIRVLLLLILLLILLLSFYGNFSSVYGKNMGYGKFSIAYNSILDENKCEVIFGQYLRSYYLRNLNKDIQIVDLLNNQDYEYSEFIREIKNYNSGWITWETRKGGHIQDEIKDYVRNNFIKIHGTGLDNTNVELYYFNNNLSN